MAEALGPGCAPSTEEAVARSDALRTDGVLNLPNSPEIKAQGSVWDAGDRENRTFQWSLHSWFLFDAPLTACAATRDQRHLNGMASLVNEWRNRFFRLLPPEAEFPWHDHATAYRLERLCRARLVMETEKIADPEFAQILEHLAGVHGTVLAREDFYSRNTNHGFDQAVALYMAAFVFPEHPQAAAWAVLARERIRAEVAFAFTDEGIHVENSPGYHAGMIANLARAERIMEATGGQNVLNLRSIIDGAVEFMAFILRPDRVLPYIGDTTRRRPNVSSPALMQAATFPALQFAVSGGRQGSAPAKAGQVYPEAGYAVYRSSWSDWRDQTHLIVKCGNRSAYHRHDDDLNVLLYARGEDWLIDSGMYNHQQKDPVRIYMRSALAHNVPVFDGVSIRRSPDPDLSDWGLALLEAGPSSEMRVEAVSRMYANLRVTRVVDVVNRDLMNISDSINGKRAGPGYWLWHFPADKRISVNRHVITVTGRDSVMRLAVAGRPADGLFRVFSGRQDPRFWSLASEKFGQVANSKVAVFGPYGGKELRFVISFARRQAST